MATRHIVLESDRFALTTWAAGDWRRFHELSGDPRITRYIRDGSPWDAVKTRDFVAQQIANDAELGYCLWQLRIKPALDIDGLVGLQPFPEVSGVEIGWWLRPRLWGRGYASEAGTAAMAHAFAACRLDSLYAVIQPDNAASRRVAERLGMALDHARDHRGIDVVIYRRDRPGG
ncbi:MAG: GNAT family N-acetyltransferase [Alphaproteobacteria bacterium]